MFGSVGGFLVSLVGAVAVFGFGHWSGRADSLVAAWVRGKVDLLLAILRGD